MKNTLLLETETGRLTFADVFTINVQLFQVNNIKYNELIRIFMNSRG